MSIDETVENDGSLIGEAMEHDDRRDTQRRSVLWPAILHIGEHQFNCQIRNFSMGGLKLHLKVPLKEGTAVEVELPRHDVVLRAEVAWQEGDKMGVRFLEEARDIRAVFGKSIASRGMDIPGPEKAFAGALSA